MTLDTDAKRGKFMAYRVVQAGSNHGRAKPQLKAVKPHQLGLGTSMDVAQPRWAVLDWPRGEKAHQQK